MKILKILIFLFLFPFYLNSYQQIYEEIELDPSYFPVPVGGRFPPSIAYNPLRREFFVVCAKPEDIEEGPVYNDVYGAFVDEETGEVSKTFVIAGNKMENEIQADVIFDGEKFFVVWANTTQDKIYGVFIDQDGNLYPGGVFEIPLSDPQGWDYRDPSVAFNGNYYLVAWSAEYEISKNNTKFRTRLIGCIRLDINGNHIDSRNRIVSPVEYTFNRHPDIATDGSNFVIVWFSARKYLLARYFSYDGNFEPGVLEIANYVISDTVFPSSVVFKDSKFFTVFSSALNLPSDIYGAFFYYDVSEEKLKLEQGSPFKIISGGDNSLIHPYVKVKGEFYISYEERDVSLGERHIYAFIMGRGTQPQKISVLPELNEYSTFSMGEDKVLFSWEFAGNPLEPVILVGRRTDLELNPVENSHFYVFLTMNNQSNPGIAYNGKDMYLVVWEDNRSAGYTPYPAEEKGIYGTFLTVKGEVLNVPAFEISDIVGQAEDFPSVVYNPVDNRYLVIYFSKELPKNYPVYLKGRFVYPDGSIGNEFIIAGPFKKAYLTKLIYLPGNRYAICFVHEGALFANFKVIILDNNGNIINKWLLGQGDVNAIRKIDMDYISTSSGSIILFASFVQLGFAQKGYLIHTSASIPPIELTLFPILNIKNFAITSNGNEFVVIGVKSVYTGDELYLRTVKEDGSMSEIKQIYTSSNTVHNIEMEYDGWEYLMTLEYTPSEKIGVLTLSQDLTFLTSIPKVVESGYKYQKDVNLTNGPGNRVVAVYKRYKEDPYRVSARFLEFFEVDDTLSLAFNSNVNLARDPVTDTIHLVFGRKDKIYYRKGFMLERTLIGGPRILWEPVIEIGKGFDPLKGYTPSLTLDYNGNPHITWVRNDTVLYRRREAGVWSQEYIISYEPDVSKMSPVITVSKNHTLPEMVHILYADANPYMIRQRIMEAYFPADNPSQITSVPVYQTGGYVVGVFPSVDFLGNLHLSFEVKSDVTGTIYYATRDLTSNEWQIHGNVFDYWGTNSSTPMTEVYGDSVYIVWTRLMEDGQHDVVRASRYLPLQDPTVWNAGNFSRTPASVPDPYYQAPVNSGGLYTVWVDVSGTGEYDIFTRDPFDRNLLRNLTNSEGKAIFPEIFSLWRRRPATSLLGLVWMQEDITQPQPLYNISSRIYGFIPLYYPAYYTLQGGSKTPSIHLTYRDTFIDTWAYPVDIGYDSITVKFYLDPKFEYEIVVQAYLEKDEGIYSHDDDDEEEWEQEIYLDGRKKKKMEIEFGELEEKKLFVPPGFYNDGVLRVKIKRKKGDFAVIHRILVYRYDRAGDEEFKGAGIQTEKDVSLITGPFVKTLIGNSLLIEFPEKLRERKPVYIYSILGRRVSDFVLEPGKRTYRIGFGENALPSGIYLLRMDRKVYRIIKLR